MLPGRPIDFAQNFEDTAHTWARVIGQPFARHDGPALEMDLQLMQAIFGGIYPETMDAILCDPPAFSARVSAYLHGLA